MNLFAFATQNARTEFRQPQPDDRGPRECCATYAVVIECDGDTDRWQCPFGHTWTAPCPRPTV